VDPADNGALGHPPSWALQVSGMMFDRTQSMDLLPSKDTRSFSNLFTKIIVDLGDPSSPNHFIEWNPQLSPPSDGFEVKRLGSQVSQFLDPL
jgi:hypothetical protein